MPAQERPAVFTAKNFVMMRRTAISGFSKHLLFYKFDGTELFVLRVIHGARDLESFL
jgi:toxin ParE1/3/4